MIHAARGGSQLVLDDVLGRDVRIAQLEVETPVWIEEVGPAAEGGAEAAAGVRWVLAERGSSASAQWFLAAAGVVWVLAERGAWLGLIAPPAHPHP